MWNVVQEQDESINCVIYQISSSTHWQIKAGADWHYNKHSSKTDLLHYPKAL
jgi:hypothetical protein